MWDDASSPNMIDSEEKARVREKTAEELSGEVPSGVKLVIL